MPGYVRAALHSFQYKKSKRQQDSPYLWKQPIYEKKIICYHRKHQSKNWMNIIKKDSKCFGKSLYYDISIDPTTLMALKSLAALQTKPTIKTAKKTQLLKLQRGTYRHSNRIQRKRNDYPHLFGCTLHITTESQSRAGGFFFLGQKSNTPIQTIPPEN